MTPIDLIEQTNSVEPIDQTTDPMTLTPETDPTVLRHAVTAALRAKASFMGEVRMPCVPAMLDYYVDWLFHLFALIGRAMPEDAKEGLRNSLIPNLVEGFEASAHSQLVVRYKPSPPPRLGMDCQITFEITTLAEQYATWLDYRKPPLFGSHPDAKLMELVERLPGPAPVLDIGAGTGRNTLPLARLGYPVDALELTPEFADQMRAAAEADELPIRVITSDILAEDLKLPRQDYQIALASEVVSHFRSVEQLRLLLSRLSESVLPGGWVLFNMFLAVDGYEPDLVTRQVAQVMVSSLFTRTDLMSALEGLPLVLISDELAHEYEQQHLPEEAWPPTGWFPDWAMGRNLFQMNDLRRPPMELRWILCQRQ